ncbi:DUF3592 domain-containing protein [Streptomyces huiliensis]|uniref:DUF3592 domain-containing protein n=1 Tax=Streptomyces huiliensis TaxID=2876027 RepID=UPI001CBD0081|nr:DUF3592 domain-containing protein [Streptomyces huiliensis]MBZ4321161.1 DUF3592 domain-containing protein [Streptomyces huiliensis]
MTSTSDLGPPRRWPVTLGLVVLLPVNLAACGWLNQAGSGLLLAVSVVLTLLLLAVAGALCGAGPGTCLAVLGFAFVLFAGPALDDYVLDRRGTRHEAVVTANTSYHRKHDTGHTCTVVRSDGGRIRTYGIDDSQGCRENFAPGRRVTLVVDPEDWLAARLSNETHGLSSGMAWTCGGLLAAMEAFILYGRLRRKARYF